MDWREMGIWIIKDTFTWQLSMFVSQASVPLTDIGFVMVFIWCPFSLWLKNTISYCYYLYLVNVSIVPDTRSE